MITGIVLAAGAGRRFGRPKADVVLRGERLLDRAVTTLRDGGCDEVLAVVRAAEVTAAGARSIVNPTPERGMGSSLRLGVAEAAGSACVVLLVDLPGVRADEVAAVIAAYRAGSPVVAVRRAGARSHPVLVSRPWLADFAAAAVGDQGGRQFFTGHDDLVTYLDYPDEIRDIDTPEDLGRS